MGIEPVTKRCLVVVLTTKLLGRPSGLATGTKPGFGQSTIIELPFRRRKKKLPGCRGCAVRHVVRGT